MPVQTELGDSNSQKLTGGPGSAGLTEWRRARGQQSIGAGEVAAGGEGSKEEPVWSRRRSHGIREPATRAGKNDGRKCKAPIIM